jgi:hypothetical protein
VQNSCSCHIVHCSTFRLLGQSQWRVSPSRFPRCETLV